MSIFSFRSTEPLYIVYLRDSNAHQMLQQWAKTYAGGVVTVETNKMKIYEVKTLHLFQITWDHSWDNILIWDCWTKRHI